MKFQNEIRKQTQVTLWQPYHLIETQKIQYGSQGAILKVTSLKIYRLLPIQTSNMLLKFGFDIQS